MEVVANPTFQTEVLLESSLASSERSQPAVVARRFSKASTKRRPRVEEIEVHFGSEPQPLPSNINLAAVTEKVLREVPFATGRAGAMWRAFLLSEAYSDLCVDSFWWVLAHEIRGMPYNSQRSPQYRRMARAYTQLFFKVPHGYKDRFFGSFSEAWTLTVLLCLQGAFPSSKGQFDTPDFRGRLLDLCAEWTTGSRPSVPQNGHWIQNFDQRPHTADADLIKTRMAFGDSLGKTHGALPSQGNTKGLMPSSWGGPGQGGGQQGRPAERTPMHTRCKYGHSPLVQHYLAHSQTPLNPGLVLNLSITSEASRPLTPFMDMAGPEPGCGRPRSRAALQASQWRASKALEQQRARCSTADALSALNKRRRDVMAQHQRAKKETLRDVEQMKSAGAEERLKIDLQASKVFGTGDVHEYSNFLLKTGNYGTPRAVKEAKARRSKTATSDEEL